MTKKAKVKVGIDTKQAKADLKGLAKEGEKSAGRVNDAMGGGFGRAAALGGVAGAGFGLAQRAASRVAGFMPDVLSEGTVGFRTRIDEALSGGDARAARGAREQTKAAYAEIVGRMKNPSVTPEIKNYYNRIKGMREITERGNIAIDKELGGEIVKDGIAVLQEALSGGFQSIIDALAVGGK